MATVVVPLDEFLGTQRPPSICDRGTTPLRLRALRRNPYSWFWASALAITHVVPALLTSKPGRILAPGEVIARANRWRLIRISVAAAIGAAAVAEALLGRPLGVVAVLALGMVLEATTYLVGIRAVFDAREGIVIVKHLPHSVASEA